MYHYKDNYIFMALTIGNNEQIKSQLAAFYAGSGTVGRFGSLTPPKEGIQSPGAEPKVDVAKFGEVVRAKVLHGENVTAPKNFQVTRTPSVEDNKTVRVDGRQAIHMQSSQPRGKNELAYLGTAALIGYSSSLNGSNNNDLDKYKALANVSLC